MPSSRIWSQAAGISSQPQCLQVSALQFPLLRHGDANSCLPRDSISNGSVFICSLPTHFGIRIMKTQRLHFASLVWEVIGTVGASWALHSFCELFRPMELVSLRPFSMLPHCSQEEPQGAGKTAGSWSICWIFSWSVAWVSDSRPQGKAVPVLRCRGRLEVTKQDLSEGICKCLI